jgi:hypothetical protein
MPPKKPVSAERISAVERWVAENNVRHDSLSAIRALARSQKVKGDPNAITVAEVDVWYRSQDVNQLRIAPHRREAAEAYVITANPFTYQADVFHMDADLARSNGGIKSVLLFVDILSRYAFAYPIKSERMETSILPACERFYEEARQVNGIVADDAFSAAAFHAFWDERSVVVDTVIAAHDHRTASGDRLGIIDRLVATLRQKIVRYMDVEATDTWVDALPEIMQRHNEAVSSALDGRSPDEIFNESDLITLALKADSERDRNREVAARNRIGISVGDKVRVRVTRDKVVGKKTTTWSRAVFTVIEKTFHKLRLKDDSDREVAKRYSAAEVLRVSDDAKTVPDPGAKGRGATRTKRKLKAAGVDPNDILPIGRRKD